MRVVLVYLEDFKVGGAPGEFVEVDWRVRGCGSPGVEAEGDSPENTIDRFHAWVGGAVVLFTRFIRKDIVLMGGSSRSS